MSYAHCFLHFLHFIVSKLWFILFSPLITCYPLLYLLTFYLSFKFHLTFNFLCEGSAVALELKGMPPSFHPYRASVELVFLFPTHLHMYLFAFPLDQDSEEVETVSLMKCDPAPFK